MKESNADQPLRYNNRLHSVWLNMHVGGLHWIHNDLTEVNLGAVHSCPVCRAFRSTTNWQHGKAANDALAAAAR